MNEPDRLRALVARMRTYIAKNCPVTSREAGVIVRDKDGQAAEEWLETKLAEARAEGWKEGAKAPGPDSMVAQANRGVR